MKRVSLSGSQDRVSYVLQPVFLKRVAATIIVVLILGLSACEDRRGPASSGKPNILVYVVDDQGSSDAGCYGNPVIKTPALDLLAENGTRFTRAYCTTASCAASRSVILSGLYNHANGMYGHEHARNHFRSFENFESLPNRLSEAGYRTARSGKYHVGPESVYRFDQQIERKPAPVDWADNCRSFIEGDGPFFLYFATTEPHRPFRREGSDVIAPEDVIVPDYLPDIPECREELAQYYMSVQKAEKPLGRLMEILQESGHWDDTIIMYLSDNGIAFPGAKTTAYEPGIRLPCVFRDPQAKKKGIVSDAMITWVDITPTLLDYAGALPDSITAAAALRNKYAAQGNTPRNKYLHGRSFREIVDQEHPEGWDEMYASHTFHEITMYYPMRIVRQQRFKLIWNIASGLPYPFASDLYASKTWQAVLQSGREYYGQRLVSAYLQRPAFELYDLQTDPHEVKNLAGDPAYAEILQDLQDKLRAFQDRTEDPWQLKWNYE